MADDTAAIPAETSPTAEANGAKRRKFLRILLIVFVPSIALIALKL